MREERCANPGACLFWKFYRRGRCHSNVRTLVSHPRVSKGARQLNLEGKIEGSDINKVVNK